MRWVLRLIATGDDARCLSTDLAEICRPEGLGDIPALKGDAGWEPLLVTPPHPEYPSAHAIFSGAAEAVLRGYFGSDEINVSVTAPGPFGVTRTYRKFSELTAEVDNARVWGGIHFRSADVDGTEIGRKIGEIVLREFPNSPRKTAQLGERP